MQGALHNEDLFLFDVIIVDAGPAGLSAALVLGRCRRSVLVCDTGQHRNAASQALHGFLTRDGVAPAELLRLGREQLGQYESVEVRTVAVIDAIRRATHFEVTLGDRTQAAARKLLLATGMVDDLPAIPGIEACYGKSVFHCPYCDGWEVRDQPLAIYGRGEHGRAARARRTRPGSLVASRDHGARRAYCPPGRDRWLPRTHRFYHWRGAPPSGAVRAYV